MPHKSLHEERQVILARDHRRRYGARIFFRILHPQHIGTLANVTLLLPNGTFGRIRPETRPTWEPGSRYELEIEGFASAADAEDIGMRAAQALLLMSLDLDFGLRLEYSNHHPATVYDRTVTSGDLVSGYSIVSWPDNVVLGKLADGFLAPVGDRKLTMSMELLASSYLEANDRARFIMAVSALEPLAHRCDLGDEVNAFVQRTLESLRSDSSVPNSIRPSLEGRLQLLRKESVRQSLMRLAEKWFPGNSEASGYLQYVYRLRSELLHEGAVSDLDILLSQEIPKVRRHVRHIYEQEYRRTFQATTSF